MATLWGILGIQDRDTTVDQVGQATIFEAIAEATAAHNAEMEQMTSLFVEETTTNHTETYKLPGGGMMQESDELTRPGAIKPVGEYSVAYDLRDARDQVAWDDVSVAYLTLQDLQRTLQTVYVRHANWVRFQIAAHILRNVNDVFPDRVRGQLTIRRLANQDGTLYPSLFAGGQEAEANHYLVSGFESADIDAESNPFPTMRALLETYFGPGNPIAFINPQETPVVSLLPNFVPTSDPNIRPGAMATELIGGPGVTHPGRLIGRCDEVWVVEWQNMPANYIYMQDLNQPGPLKKRVDTPTGIAGRGELALVATQDEFPLRESFWRDRHGYGVGNRLNGVVMELTEDLAYDIPALYA